MTQHVFTMPEPTMNECTHTIPRPAMNEHTPSPVMPMHTMNDCAPTMPRPTRPMPTMNEHTLTTPRPTVSVPSGHTLTASMYTMPTMSDSTVPMHAMPMHTMPQLTVPGPTLPEGKPQPDMSSIVVHPSIPPAPVVPQPQVVLVKQFKPPKPYTGASSWKGYREYFERLAAVNGWTTVEQKVEQLALALKGPASEVLRYLDTSHPQAYNIIWESLARRFGSLDGAREAMRRFDSRRHEDNETIPDFEQALRTLHKRGLAHCYT